MKNCSNKEKNIRKFWFNNIPTKIKGSNLSNNSPTAIAEIFFFFEKDDKMLFEKNTFNDKKEKEKKQISRTKDSSFHSSFDRSIISINTCDGTNKNENSCKAN